MAKAEKVTVKIPKTVMVEEKMVNLTLFPSEAQKLRELICMGTVQTHRNIQIMSIWEALKEVTEPNFSQDWFEGEITIKK